MHADLYIETISTNMNRRPQTYYKCGLTGHIASAHREGGLVQGNNYVAAAANVHLHAALVSCRGGGLGDHRGRGVSLALPISSGPSTALTPISQDTLLVGSLRGSSTPMADSAGTAVGQHPNKSRPAPPNYCSKKGGLGAT